MNRIEEYLQNLDKRSKTALYLSILIIIGFIYYRFNYEYLFSKIYQNKQKIVKLKRKMNLPINNYKIKLSLLKKKYHELWIEKNKKYQDLEYLNERIEISLLKINDKNFYSLLAAILKKADKLNIFPNFYISKSFNMFKKYIVEIKGYVGICEEEKIFDLIKFLESIKYVTNISRFDLEKINEKNNKKEKFYIQYQIWGIK